MFLSLEQEEKEGKAGRGGSLERPFIFCHILVPADCPGVTGG